MKKRLKQQVPLFVALATTLCFATGASAQSDTDQIKAVVDSYHTALVARDLPKMESLWTKDDNVTLVNPGDRSISVGWGAVGKDWANQFNVLAELKIRQSDGPHITVKGDVAWSVGIVDVVFKFKSDFSGSSLTYETDVFEKRDGAWLLAAHTALDMAPPPK